jgi:hypothetical protein
MDFDEDMDKHGTETDEDDDVYFDTREMFSHLRKNHSDSPGNLSDFDDASPKTNRISSSSSIDLVASSYPYVKRRERLPEPKEKEKETSLWSLIKGNIGTDLTRVCLPVSFNEPISSLQKCFEDLEYSHLLDRAYEWGKQVYCGHCIRNAMWAYENMLSMCLNYLLCFCYRGTPYCDYSMWLHLLCLVMPLQKTEPVSRSIHFWVRLTRQISLTRE